MTTTPGVTDMTTTLRRTRRPRRSFLPIDRLDARIVPAALIDVAATAPVLALDPAPGATLSAGPTAVVATFARPIDPSTLGSADLRVDALGPDGTWSPVRPDSPPTETLDVAGTHLSITFDRPLTPRSYRVVIDSNASLFGLDGSPIAGSGDDIVLGDFAVLRPGVKLADAADLGPAPAPGATTAAAGTLNLSADPEAVALYKVTVPAGQSMRLGLEVAAQRQGSPLAAAVALLDSRGRALATGTIGRASAPSDPYLFQTVGPGTYYVGVSGAGNLPGVAGGYDVAAGIQGIGGRSQAGGAYTLRLVADPILAPTTYTGLSLTVGDPRDGAPTSLSVNFSGPIRADLMGGNAGDVANGYRLVDAYGRSWPISITTLSERSGRADFVARDRLPAGLYTLRASTTTPQLDLGGRPVRGTGLDPTVIGRFTVAPTAAVADPNDLGSLFADDLISAAGAGKGVSLGAGQVVDLHTTLTYEDFYKFSLSARGDGLSATLIDAQGRVVSPISVGTSGQTAGQLMHLEPGRYTLRLVAAADGPTVSARLSIRTPGSWPEKLLDNGIGQGSALNLRLAAPSDGAGETGPADAAPSTPVTTPAPAVDRGSGTADPSASPSAPTAAASLAPVGASSPTPGATSAAPAAPGVYLALGGAPIGRPEHAAPASPASPSSTEGPAASAMPGQALASTGPLGGLGLDLGSSPSAAEPTPPADPTAPGADARAGLVLAEPPATADPAIERAEGWRKQLDRLVAGLVGDPSAVDLAPVELPGEPVTVAAADIPAETAAAEPSGLALPAGIGLLAALGLRVRRYVAKRKAARLPAPTLVGRAEA